MTALLCSEWYSYCFCLLNSSKGSRMRKFALLLLFLGVTALQAAKITDIASVVGVRDNQLIGYGLVVGLDGTGDGTTSTFTLQSLANMLLTMNVKIDAATIKSKNVAAVVVTAELDSFSRQGDKLDVQIASIGDAKSLKGGILVMTPLKGVDGKIYALAQGAMTLTNEVSRAGSIFSGATVEREISYDLYNQNIAKLSLKQSSFTNAIQVQSSLNDRFNEEIAVALDPKTIKLKRPENLSMVEFLALIESVDIDYTPIEKIIINEKTGTIVAGIDIAVDPVVITHNEITIKIVERSELPTADANTAALGDDVRIGMGDNQITTKRGASTVANIARSLQRLGAKPADVIAILEAIKRSGAIKAEIEVI